MPLIQHFSHRRLSLQRKLRFDRSIGNGPPLVAELGGPLKEVTVLAPTGDDNDYLLSQWDRVTGSLLSSRLFDLQLGQGAFADLAVDPTDGSSVAGGRWSGTADFGTGPEAAQSNSAAFLLSLNR